MSITLERDAPPPEFELRVAELFDEFRAATTNALLDRWRFFKQQGITFNGLRDLYEILGYDRFLTVADYYERYRRGGIAKRIVECLPKATWRGEVEVIEDEDPKTYTTFEQAWVELDQRLKITTAVLPKVDVLAGLSYYAVLLIGAPGDRLSDELPRARRSDQVLYFQPFLGTSGPFGGRRTGRASSMFSDSFGGAAIQSYDTDIRSPRFGFPQTYQLTRVDLASPDLQVPVHWSRVIHVAEDCLDNDVFGQPTLECVWNYLDDLDKVRGGGSEAFWLRANQGLHINVDKDLTLKSMGGTTPETGQKALDDLKKMAEDYTHQLQRIITTRGVDVKPLGSDTANFSGPQDAILTLIAGARGIPKRVLTGSEMGELASSQDRDNWTDQINGRQILHAGPNLMRQLIDRLVAYNYLPTPAKGADKYDIKWPHNQRLTEKEKTDGAKGWAEVNRTAGYTIFTDAEIRDKWYGMEPTEEADTEVYKAEGALKMATVNKTMGKTIFTPEEMRRTWYDWKPLPPEQEVPLGAPERISTKTAPALETPGGALPIAAEAQRHLLHGLEAALAANDEQLVAQILGAAFRASAEWNEEQHPRNERGQFGSGGGSSSAMLDKPASHFEPLFAAGRDTREKFSDGKGNYTSERQKLHDEIVAKYLTGTTPVEHPSAMILGGGMASGKTTMVNSEHLAHENTVNVNVDLIRSDLPETRAMIAAGEKMNVTLTHEEASDISGQLMRAALSGQRNMTLDGTGDTTLEKLGGKVAVMRRAGHSVEANYVTTSVEEAQRRADHRAETTDRRFVAPTAMREVHGAVSRIFPEAIRQGLFDKAQLFDTSGPLGQRPTLVASGVGRELTIHDQTKWESFLAKGRL